MNDADADDAPRPPVAPKVRWSLVIAFELALIIIMLTSTATWPVRAVVIGIGSVVIASINAGWREDGLGGGA